MVLRSACLSGARKASPIRFDSALLGLFAHLRPSTSDEDLEDVIRFFAEAWQLAGIPVAMDEIDFTTAAVEVRGVLEELWAKEAAAPSQASDEHVLLLLDKDTCVIPWESLPILRRRSVSRVPTLHILADQLSKAQKTGQAPNGALLLDQRRTRYLLNPGGDLKRSEDRFQPWLSRRETESRWKGITGRAPFANEFADALSNSDLMMYFGHSGAEQYVRPSALKKLRHCAATMLWGCSSGVLLDHGDFDRTGTPYNYMMAGCPALVCNLWDMTDRELDNVSESVFLRLGLMRKEDAQEGLDSTAPKTRVTPIPVEPISLPLAVAQARDDCKLPFLTGAACIVYGIPVQWKPLS